MRANIATRRGSVHEPTAERVPEDGGGDALLERRLGWLARRHAIIGPVALLIAALAFNADTSCGDRSGR